MHAGPEEIAEAIARLKGGGIVAFPTETVYGLGARAFDQAAVARVFEVKGRPPINPLIVHVSGEGMAREVASAWPSEARRLAKAFWPGPLSMVVKKADRVPANVTAGGDTVAVRCPDHPLTLALIEALGEPLVGPSANVSGRVSPTDARHVREAFTDEQVYVLDGGPCRGGIESTVVDLSGGEARILRPGLVTGEMIAQELGRKTVRGGGGPDGSTLRSPGLLPQHYAPATRTVLVDAAAVTELGKQHPGRSVVVGIQGHSGGEILLPADARGYAAGLYRALRDADASGADLIAVVRPPVHGEDQELWEAVMDRLLRATADR